jgi:hypothetical protein
MQSQKKLGESMISSDKPSYFTFFDHDNTLSISVKKPSQGIKELVSNLCDRQSDIVYLSGKQKLRSNVKKAIVRFYKKYNSPPRLLLREIAAGCGIKSALKAQKDAKDIEELYKKFLLRESLIIRKNNKLLDLFQKHQDRHSDLLKDIAIAESKHSEFINIFKKTINTKCHQYYKQKLPEQDLLKLSKGLKLLVKIAPFFFKKQLEKWRHYIDEISLILVDFIEYDKNVRSFEEETITSDNFSKQSISYLEGIVENYESYKNSAEILDRFEKLDQLYDQCSKYKKNIHTTIAFVDYLFKALYNQSALLEESPNNYRARYRNINDRLKKLESFMHVEFKTTPLYIKLKKQTTKTNISLDVLVNKLKQQQLYQMKKLRLQIKI